MIWHLLPGEQRDWHLRVALALEPVWGSAGAGAIAEHYRLANRPEEELPVMAVKARKNFFFQSICLFWIFGRDHLIC